MIKTTVIIPTKNAGAGFEKLLFKIASQRTKEAYETLIIDSGSTDNTLATAHIYSAMLNIRIYTIPPQDFGHGKTRNLAATLANGDNLIYTVQDALPVRNEWLQTLINELNNGDYVFGKQIPWYNTVPPERYFYHNFFPNNRIEVTNNDKQFYKGNMFVSNCNAAIKKDTWRKYRFDDDILMGCDKELAARMLKDGCKLIYTPYSPVYHAHNYTFRSLLQRSIEGGKAVRQMKTHLPNDNKAVIRKRIDYFTGELSYLWNNGFKKWIPYSTVYEGTRFIGKLLSYL